jgi:hypothetical protein
MAKAKRRKRGPKTEKLAIGGNWEVAVNKALMKKKPKGGWPKKTGK